MSEPKDNLYRMEPKKLTVNERLRSEMDARDQALGVALKNSAAALGNEALTRERVQALEGWRADGLLARLKWLLFGSAKKEPFGTVQRETQDGTDAGSIKKEN